MARIELGTGTTAPVAPGDGGDQSCAVTIDERGIYIEALESGSLPHWQATFTWETVQRLLVEPTPVGVAITITDRGPRPRRVELRDTSFDAVEAAVASFRNRIGNAPALQSPADMTEQPDDFLFEVRDLGIEVWLSEDIAIDHEDKVVAFVEWLRTYPEVDEAIHEDRELVVAIGDFSHRNLKRDAKKWWRQRNSRHSE